MPLSQTQMALAVLLLVAALVDRATCGSTIIKVPPIKPGVQNQTIVVNVPDTVEVTRAEQRANDTSAQLVLMPAPQSPPASDCLLSDCDENDVGCDGLPPCGPFCPPEACSRVNCSQCWQAGFSRPCCWSCCSQYMPYTYSQPALTAPQQRQQSSFYTYSQSQLRPLPISQPQLIPIQQLQSQPIPIPQPQLIPIPQPQPIPIPQQQAIPIPQPQPIPIPQPQPFPIPQLQPIPVPQPQPIPIPQPRPVPFPVSVPQPYAVPQPFPHPQPQPQLQLQPQTQVQQFQSARYYPSSPCRPIPSWPFVQCPPQKPPICGPWYQPGCIPPPTWPNLCYTVGPC